MTFTFDPSLLLLGFGCIIGILVGLSLLLGAALAWGGIAPWLIAQDMVRLPPGSTGPQFTVLIEWLLWPGVSLMVCATLATLALRMVQQSRAQTEKSGAFAFLVRSPRPWPGFFLRWPSWSPAGHAVRHRWWSWHC